MPSGHGTKYPRKKDLAIAALLKCSTIEDAAKEVGVSSKTIRRWLDDFEFVGEYVEARVRVYDHAIARMQGASGQAVSAILDVLSDPKTPAAPRLQAALTIIDVAKRATANDQSGFPSYDAIVRSTDKTRSAIRALRSRQRAAEGDPSPDTANPESEGTKPVAKD
jgi:transposase-like protein